MPNTISPQLFALCLSLIPSSSPATCSDLSLVLAIDSSSSIEPPEFALQITGYATAFSAPTVQHALEQAGTVDIAAVFWADSDFGFQTIGWHRIRTVQDALTFGAALQATDRRVVGDTDIGAGLMAALDMLDQPDRCTLRKVVNVSGDGKATQTIKRRAHSPLAIARARAASLGVTVNGLAISNTDLSLGAYYTHELITGPDAFVIEITGFDSFSTAIIQKLTREIGLPVSASLEQRLLK